MKNKTFKYESCSESSIMTNIDFGVCKAQEHEEQEEAEILCLAAENMMDGLQRAINALDTAPEFLTDEGISSHDLLHDLESALRNPPLALWMRHKGRI